MTRKEEPIISSKYDGQDFTCIRFKPDLKLFKMQNLDNDIVALFTKRVYDMAGITHRKVRVMLNGS